MRIAIDNSDNVYEFNELKIFKDYNSLINKTIESMTQKERLLNAKSMIMIDKNTGKIIFEFNMIHAQHFYPLSILDYAKSLQALISKRIPSLPILSLDSHDYGSCDFNCKDCLAVETREWARKNLNFTLFDPEHYEKVLTEISRYSKERGCDSVRLEMSGEGNPDMYPHRARIIKYAAEKCNMKIVYVSSGSRLDEETIDALAKYAYYIRISFPGINESSYKKYSNQKTTNDKEFGFHDALKLIEKLVEKRKQYNREGELVIGARTCIRKENEGDYFNTAKRLKNAGADCFQIVKILIPIGENIGDYGLSKSTVEELSQIHSSQNEFGKMSIQIPQKLDYMYYDRKIEESLKPSKCYSSFVSPILYGPYLVICTHWKKIKDLNESYYGFVSGEKNQLETLMHNEKALKNRRQVPEKCEDCCSIYDNLLMEMIRSQLALVKDVSDVEFLLTY